MTDSESTVVAVLNMKMNHVGILKGTDVMEHSEIIETNQQQQQQQQQQQSPDMIHSESNESNLDYLNIPLPPPLSPSKNPHFIKRTNRIIILENLFQSIKNKSLNSLKNCISIAYGLVRSTSSIEFEDDYEQETLMLQMSMIMFIYVNLLVNLIIY
ncbi:FAR1 [Candida pseudojiufengensis]|uniref:FAR1 n=1 Tax=Candida pseudojiufengensis TaxID=497109 RepID=UPI002224B73D|nr:FAR1 [Candida pseudojiufengensis]KAI5960464.1 FAR1 [Candida pseudojiufengensis]